MMSKNEFNLAENHKQAKRSIFAPQYDVNINWSQ